MRIGVPCESVAAGAFERRVALTPHAVADLVAEGHQLRIQSGAGDGAGYTDSAYEAAGATIAWQRAEVMGAEIIVCLSRLMTQDLAVLAPGTPVIAFHQLGLAPMALRRQYAHAEVVAIGLDRLRDPEGRYPAVAALSELAGALAPSIAARMLESTGPGRPGVLLGRLPGVPPTEVVILGAGTLGSTAAAGFAGLGCNVHLLDRDLDALRAASRHLPANVSTALAGQESIDRSLRFANVFVGALREHAELVQPAVTEEQVSHMRPGAAILDFAVTEGRSVATSRPITHPDDIYAMHGVWHFTMPNATALVARTASKVLSAALLPFVRLLGTGITPKAHRVFAPAIHFGEGLQ